LSFSIVLARAALAAASRNSLATLAFTAAPTPCMAALAASKFAWKVDELNVEYSPPKPSWLAVSRALSSSWSAASNGRSSMLHTASSSPASSSRAASLSSTWLWLFAPPSVHDTGNKSVNLSHTMRVRGHVAAGVACGEAAQLPAAVGAAPRPLPRLPGDLAPACRRVISAQRGLYRYFSARAKFAWKHRDTSVLHGTLRGHKCGILN